MTSEEWIQANQVRAARALESASDALYELLGGQVDPGREREALEAEAARLKLSMQLVDPPPSGSRRSARTRPRRRDGR
jgi:hypothetical protein